MLETDDINQSSLNLEDFAYELPPELIAQNAADKRDQSRLLYYNRQTKKITHCHFYDIVSVLKAGDVLVVNNTRVIPARLIGKKRGGGAVEFLLLKQETPGHDLWQAMAAPIRKLKIGEVITIQGKENIHKLVIENIFAADDGQNRALVRFLNQDNKGGIYAVLQDAGLVPLPPYIVRDKDKKDGLCQEALSEQTQNDFERYQTVFAKEPGAVAAPTAGLHFTDSLLSQLKAKGITICEITLHVGAGTFKPISTEIENHILDPEWFTISETTAQIINAAKQNQQRIIAVGTTTCRTLESRCVNGKVMPTDGSTTSLFIKPGYKFKLIDGLVTNFHLSKSSLLLLVATLVGKEELKRAYELAIENRYRFYSYGDAMIII